MDKERNSDTFDRHFQQLFENERPAQEGWNEPPESIWEGVSAVLKDDAVKKKKRRGFFWWLFGSGLGILAITAMLLYSSQPHEKQVSEGPVTVVNADQKPDQGVEEMAQNESARETRASETNSSSSAIVTEEPKTAAKDKSSKKTQLVSNTQASAGAGSPAGNLGSLEHNVNSNLLFPIAEKATTTSAPIIERELMETFPLLYGPRFSDLEIYNEGALPMVQEYNSPIIPVTKKAIRLSLIGHVLHPSLLQNKTKDAVPFSYNIENGQAFRIGITAEKPIGNGWSLSSGLSLERLRFKSTYELAVNYTSDQEFLGGDGHFHNTYSHTLPAVSGDVTMTHILFRFSSIAVNEGELVPFDLVLDHRMDQLYIPISLHWTKGSGPWSWQVQTGFGVGIKLSHLMTDISSLQVDHTDLHYNTSTVDADIDNQTNNVNLRVHLAGQLNYRLTPRWTISMGPTVEQYITPLSSQAYSKILPLNAGLHIGIGLQL